MSMVREQFEVVQKRAQDARGRVAMALLRSDVEFTQANAEYEESLVAAAEAWAQVLVEEPDANVVHGLRFHGTPGVGEPMMMHAARIERKQQLGL